MSDWHTPSWHRVALETAWSWNQVHTGPGFSLELSSWLWSVFGWPRVLRSTTTPLSVQIIPKKSHHPTWRKTRLGLITVVAGIMSDIERRPLIPRLGRLRGSDGASPIKTSTFTMESHLQSLQWVVSGSRNQCQLKVGQRDWMLLNFRIVACRRDSRVFRDSMEVKLWIIMNLD